LLFGDDTGREVLAMGRLSRDVARLTLRSALLVAGVVCAWSAYDAITHDAAYAAEAPRPAVLDGLVGSVTSLLDTSLPAVPALLREAPPSRPEPILSGPPPRSTEAKPGATHPRPSAPTAGGAAKARTAGGSTVVRAPLRRPVAAPTRPGSTDPVGVKPVTSALTDLVTPVLADLQTRLGVPIGAIVRPVTQPVIDTLAPVLGPVLQVLQPPVASPPAPPEVPGDGAEGTPPPPGGATPPASPPSLTPSHRDAVHRPARPEAIMTGGSRVAPVAEQTRARGAVPPPHDDLTPLEPAGSTSSIRGSGGGHGATADASLRPWTPPVLQPQHSSRASGDRLVARWPQPGTRPA
jgi:hypothetical protein